MSITLKKLPFLLMSLALNLAWAQKSPVANMGQVEITDKRDDEVQERRESTVSKIVITHEEIERMGDSTIGDVLQRQPGISMGGPPGRGSGIRMRGLSAGYTQILLDGQRVPPGFSIESLTPEMVERIEIYRAPTAEFGTQAVAGTINVITRQGKRGEPMDLKTSVASQGGQTSETVALSKQVDHGAFSANYTLSASHGLLPNHTETELTRDTAGSPSNSLERSTLNGNSTQRDAIHSTARFQFRGDPGETLTLMPFLMYSRLSTVGNETLTQTSSSGLSGNDSAHTQNLKDSVMLRLNGQWKKPLTPDSSIELKFHVGGWNNDNHQIQTAGGGGILPNLDMTSTITDRSYNSQLKYKKTLISGHEWVSGVELEQVNRAEGAYATPALLGNDASLSAHQLRYALYTQDEWQINPNWATYMGVRYEHIGTQGDNGQVQARNDSSVLSPLLHLLWRPEPNSQDQVRLGLTRSYKAPAISNLMAPYLRTTQETTNGSNGPSDPDTTGNPYLKPELATGVDLAFEHYLPDSGMLSASVFYRRVENYVRTLVAFNTTTSRWVTSPENVGQASTEGLELEAKFRLNQLLPEAPAVNLRTNLSLFRSQVLSVPGPYNQMDQQPHMTGNLGADYRFRGTSVTVGGNFNWTPGYQTQTSAEQLLDISRKHELDLYLLWKVDNTSAWRLSFFNLDPHRFATGSLYTSSALYENNVTNNQTYLNVQLRWEKKL